MNYKKSDVFLIGCLIIVILLSVFIFIRPVSADVLVYGSEPNYTAVVLPNNSYVHQGENISQGYYYDLSGVYGFSGELAHWTYDYDVGIGEPDNIVSLTHPHNVYIDPAIYPTGRWFQWDGGYCTSDGYCKMGFGNGNPYVFAVTRPIEPIAAITPVETIVRYENISILSQGALKEIPVTVIETVIPIPTPTIEAEQTIIIPTPTPAVPEVTIIEEVTPRAPIGLIIPIIGILLGGFVVCRRK